jgi:prefoldin subunit 5
MPHVDFSLNDIKMLIEESEFRIVKSVKESFDVYDDKLEHIDLRLDGMDQRFDKMDQRFDQVDQRFDKVETRLNKVEVRLDDIAVDVKATRKLVGQHSLEIMELKARTA